jgi:hypothetical protein
MPVYKVVYFTIILLGIVLGLLQWKKASRVVHWATILLILTVIIEVLATYSAKVYRNNLWVYHFFNPIQFFIITRCFWVELRYRFMYVLMYAIPIIFISISLFAQQGDFPSYSISIGFLFYILWCLLYFRVLLVSTSENSLWSYPLFWISCGWLTFCTVNLLQLSIYNSVLFSQNEVSLLWTTVINNVRIGSNIFLYLSYLIAIVKSKSNYNIKA